MSKNRYEVLGNLGCGATSRVDKARDTVLGRTVALKTLVHSFGAPTEQKQFLREAQIVSQLSHPAIVNLYDVGIEDGNVAYLVMEYVPGKTLQQVLAESTGPMPVARACAWISDLAGALHRAHRSGVIHGDIKPANILVTEDGKVKLSDFGIARFATQVSGSGKMMGTPAYLSPEQILGEPQNTRSDMFSLGIVLYQMVTGVAPFDGSSVSAVCAQILQAEPVPPSQRNPLVPSELDRIILRCLAKSSADRYPSAEAFATSLDAAVRQGNSGNVAVSAGAATASAGIGADGLPWATASVDAAASDSDGKAIDIRKRKNTWLARPLQASDAWFVAGLAALLLCSVPVVRAMRSRFQLPAAPLVASAVPHAPNDLTGETQYTEVPDDESTDVTPETVKLEAARAGDRQDRDNARRAARGKNRQRDDGRFCSGNAIAGGGDADCATCRKGCSKDRDRFERRRWRTGDFRGSVAALHHGFESERARSADQAGAKSAAGTASTARRAVSRRQESASS